MQILLEAQRMYMHTLGRDKEVAMVSIYTDTINTKFVLLGHNHKDCSVKELIYCFSVSDYRVFRYVTIHRYCSISVITSP